MASSKIPVREQILAIDIGATNIKFCHVDRHGEMLEAIRRRPTPYPCTPARLVEVLSRRIVSAQCPKVGVGFPGEFADGHVVRPGNLSRPGGIGTEVDPGLEKKWRGFALQEALCVASQREVRVVNDAALAARGCCKGEGTELVLTLGTGLGLALEVDGQPVKVRDVGAVSFLDGRSYDEVLGERSRARDEVRWRRSLGRAVAGFAEEFGASTVHLAGGNARRVSPKSFAGSPFRVDINGNEAPLHGVARLFCG
jgi:polyphosphate glucokinase